MPPRRSSRASLPSRALTTEGADRLLDLGEGHPPRVPEHRHHEAPGGAHRDADVVIALVDDVVAVDLRVDRRVLDERSDGRLDEEGHEAEADAVLLLERLAVRRTQRRHGGHVHLVEGGEHRRRVLRELQPLAGAAAQAAHGHPLLAPMRSGRRGRFGLHCCGYRCRCRCHPSRYWGGGRGSLCLSFWRRFGIRPRSRRRGRCGTCNNRGEHVALQQAATLAGPLDLRWIEAVLVEQTTHRRGRRRRNIE